MRASEQVSNGQLSSAGTTGKWRMEPWRVLRGVGGAFQLSGVYSIEGRLSVVELDAWC